MNKKLWLLTILMGLLTQPLVAQQARRNTVSSGNGSDFVSKYNQEAIYLQQGIILTRYVKNNDKQWTGFLWNNLTNEMTSIPDAHNLAKQGIKNKQKGALGILGTVVLSSILISAMEKDIREDPYGMPSTGKLVLLPLVALGGGITSSSFIKKGANQQLKAIWIYNRDRILNR